MLFDSRLMEFKEKLQNWWLGPYEVDIMYDNGAVKLRIIDEDRYSIMANGHRLKLYNKPISKDKFTIKLKEHSSLAMMELGSTNQTWYS